MNILLRCSWMPLALVVTACSVGTNEARVLPPAPDPTANAALHIVLGPASESRVTVATLNGTVRAKGVTGKYIADNDSRTDSSIQRLKTIAEGRIVGKTVFSQNNLASVEDATVILVSATGGRDIDANDDAVIGVGEGGIGPEIRGQVEALAEASTVKTSKVIVNLLTTLAAAGRVGTTDGATALKRADQFAVAVLKAGAAGDINGDGQISNLDLLSFDPSLHVASDGTFVRSQDKYLRSPRLYALLLKGSSAGNSAVSRIHAGGDTNTASKIAVQIFGDSDGNGLANVFENSAKNDSDLDGIPDAVDEDIDGDGLSNDAETAMGLNVYSRDSDGDGLADRSELDVVRTDPLNPDTDGDELMDGFEVSSSRTNPLKTDTDGDGISDSVEFNGFMLFDSTVVRTNPSDIDTDRDGLNDALEKQVQDVFAAFPESNSAAVLLRAGLNPANSDQPAQIGNLNYTDLKFDASILEDDPDGDGKPTIEEMAHGSNPSDKASTFLYIYESPDGRRSNRFTTMEAAGFVYVPGGWDVNDDGTVEPGFFLSVYEAKVGQSTVPAARLPNVLNAATVYSPATKLFSERLCSRLNGGDGMDASAADTGGSCRGNSYLDIEIGKGMSKAAFVSAGLPYTLVTWAEARVVLSGSAISSRVPGEGPFPIDLPSETQWMQAVGLAINKGANWTGGSVNSGQIVQGHSDGTPANPLSIVSLANEFDSTGNSAGNGAGQRRTLILANGVMARDFDVPLGYQAVVWDLAGNVAEWTLGAIAAKASTSQTITRAGGDRFINGLTGPVDFLGVSLSRPTAAVLDSMPPWLKPRVAGKILGLSTAAGYYLDGNPTSDQNGDGQSDGAGTSLNYGYGNNAFSDGFSFFIRGGDFRSADFAGVAEMDLQNAPGFRAAGVGFRAVASAR